MKAFESGIQEKLGVGRTGKAYLGKSVVLPGVIASVTSITVADEPLDADLYRVSGGAIEFDEDAGFEDGAAVEITYASKTTTRLEDLVNNWINVQIVFDGFNLTEEDR